jgi:hypothetical protein
MANSWAWSFAQSCAQHLREWRADTRPAPGLPELSHQTYLIAIGLIGDPVPPVITSGGPANINS